MDLGLIAVRPCILAPPLKVRVSNLWQGMETILFCESFQMANREECKMDFKNPNFEKSDEIIGRRSSSVKESVCSCLVLVVCAIREADLISINK